MLCCEICCYNDAFLLFDCDEYTAPPFGTKLYEISKYTGYNHVINQNGYNAIFVCNNCLIKRIYKCNVQKKYDLLKELLLMFKIKGKISVYKGDEHLFKNILNYCRASFQPILKSQKSYLYFEKNDLKN